MLLAKLLSWPKILSGTRRPSQGSRVVHERTAVLSSTQNAAPRKEVVRVDTGSTTVIAEMLAADALWRIAAANSARAGLASLA